MPLRLIIAHALNFQHRAWRRLRMYILRPLFGAYGKNFIFDPDGSYTFKNIFVGDDVNLGYRPVLMAALSEIRIGSHVMFGPEVVLIGGGHNTTVTQKFMTQIHEKTGNEDLGVVIEDDVWVGARTMILRGVKVGRGAVIGAGSVLTKSVPPYAVVAGNPVRVVRFRWDVETILKHEEILYPLGKRLSRLELKQLQKESAMLEPKRK
jgi:acetyltransferase-like isoleucine patch superfamily enzyme